MKKVQVKTFYFGIGSKANVDILDIAVLMWNQHYFETIVRHNDDMNIQYTVVKVFGYIKIAFYIGGGVCFSPRRKNIPHETPNYGPEKSKF